MTTNKHHIYNKVKALLCAALLPVASLVMTGCNDYLDVEPTNAQSVSNFYNSETQMDQALEGLYGALKPLPKYLLVMSEMRSDNIWVEVDVKQNDNVSAATFDNSGLLSSDLVKNCWADYYTVIASANLFLDKAEDFSFASEATKVQYQAEARFIRALAYFDLVRFFGRVPAPTHALTTEEAFSLKQSETKEVYDNVIVPDLLYAVENLAETATDYNGKTRSERVTSTAAKALLGKVYLTMSGFPLNEDHMTEATALFKEVIDYAEAQNLYWVSNSTGWATMWLHENDNKYSLFEIQYIAEKNQGNPMVTLSAPSNAGGTTYASKNLIASGTKVYVEPGLATYFRTLNAAGNNYADARAKYTINMTYTVEEDGTINGGSGNTFYVKFFENKVKRAELGYSDMDATIVDRTYWPQNYPILRLEDVMLLYAECVGKDEGAAYVNKIRTRAGLAELDADLTEDEFQEAVANERRYELAEEGHRWFDLVRQNKYVETLKAMFLNDDTSAEGNYKKMADRVTADSYLYPIPLSQMEAAEGLYTQNTGY